MLYLLYVHFSLYQVDAQWSTKIMYGPTIFPFCIEKYLCENLTYNSEMHVTS